MPAPLPVTGVLLAAGAGRRAGGPKALRHDPDGTSWLTRGVRLLGEGGCGHVVVVLGCRADDARALLDEAGPSVSVVENPSWSDGLAGSLRLGLRAVLGTEATAALVHLVDLPDVTAAVVARVLGAAPLGPAVLARAAYDGTPGHPVLVGRAHVPSLVDTLSGDEGAARFLRAAGAADVECGDLATGHDDDRPPGQRG